MPGGGFLQQFGGGVVTKMPGSTLAGIISSGRLNLATDPTNLDTVTIGGHEFRFLTTLIAATTYTQVKRGVSAAQARTDLIDAINGTTNAHVVPATTPHTLAIVADLIDTSRVRVRQASGKGGTAQAMAPASIAVSETLTAAADVWDVANLNETGSAPGKMFSHGRVTVTAAMIAAGKVFLEFPFTPTVFNFMLISSGGGIRADNEVVSIIGNSVTITLLGGASPNAQATDIMHVFASE